MNKAELIRYIRTAHTSGMAHDKIIKSLENVGWQMTDILDAFLTEKNNLDSNYLKPSVDKVITVQNITKTFGRLTALDNISFDIDAGKVIGLLGPNGAGKTTIVRILTTLLKQDSGKASVLGYDTTAKASELKSVIGLTGQFTAVDERLTGRENLELIGRLYHLSREEVSDRTTNLLEKFGLTNAADRITRDYSGGMRRRLDLAASMLNNPKVLFLDEPTTGLDPQSRIALWDIIKELSANGVTILLTTQYLEEADHLADEIIVIDHGKIIAQGTPQELKKELGGDVVEAHLSHAHEIESALSSLQVLTASKEARVDHDLGIITIPASRGSSDLLDIVRILDHENIEIADIALRQPTLDDVFLKLTGSHTSVK